MSVPSTRRVFCRPLVIFEKRPPDAAGFSPDDVPALKPAGVEEAALSVELSGVVSSGFCLDRQNAIGIGFLLEESLMV
jgi:hypothetical protein